MKEAIGQRQKSLALTLSGKKGPRDSKVSVVSRTSDEIASRGVPASAVRRLLTSERVWKGVISKLKCIPGTLQKLGKKSKEVDLNLTTSDDSDCEEPATNDNLLNNKEESVTQLSNEDILMERRLFRKYVLRSLDLLGVGDYDLTLHDCDQYNGDLREVIETIARLGHRNRIIELLCQLKLGPILFEKEYCFKLSDGYEVRIRSSDFARLGKPMSGWENAELKYTASTTAVASAGLGTIFKARKLLSELCFVSGKEMDIHDHEVCKDCQDLLREISGVLNLIRIPSNGFFTILPLVDGLVIFSAVIGSEAKALQNGWFRKTFSSSSLLSSIFSDGSQANNLVGEFEPFEFNKRNALYMQAKRDKLLQSLRKSTLASFAHAIATYSAWLIGNCKFGLRSFTSTHDALYGLPPRKGGTGDWKNWRDYFGWAPLERIEIPPTWLSSNEVRHRNVVIGEEEKTVGLMPTSACSTVGVVPVLEIPPGWESPLPACLGGLSVGLSEQNLCPLRKELQSRLRRARRDDSCVICGLHNSTLILVPRVEEAHLLSFSMSQRIGYLGSTKRTDEENLADMVEKAKIKVEGCGRVTSQSMTLPQGVSEDLSVEFGDLLHCFQGSYLVHVAGEWYIVPNPRWKRIWRILKKLSKSVRPTSIKAFMISMTWEYVDASASSLNKVFWQANHLNKKGSLFNGSASVVTALSKLLSDDVVARLGGERIATAAQEFLANCPSIFLQVEGPKRSWKMLYGDLTRPDRKDQNEESNSTPRKEQIVLDYYSERCHAFRPSVLYFGEWNRERFIRLRNKNERWIRIEDIDDETRAIRVGKRVTDIAPAVEPPDGDRSWNNPWLIG